ncbi:MAG: GTP cyclohydrolase II [Francisellaceae bacterium]|jgi:GTP cyclohydrolase II|nr:GTP cyclohydrolase II [Francisellaceae bacterium]MBT6207870.1 GTP cyclohydrolase II [Francisellaceae bacterium]MBT6539424.1 GTP cyclohydrolase II [Francisellaceae bacterium]
MSPTRDPYPIKLTSHPQISMNSVSWGAVDAKSRGPIIASSVSPKYKNVIGTYGGSYSIYRALAVAGASLDPSHIPDLTNTMPTVDIKVNSNWQDPEKIVSIDPWGHLVMDKFNDLIEMGVDIRPTIAITKARIFIPEVVEAVKEGRLKPDGKLLLEDNQIVVTKAAIEPVWHLPGMAKRFNCDVSKLRRALFEYTGGMYPELITRPDLEVFLPPIGGATAYIFGNPENLSNSTVPVTCRVHDECNGSDVFGSDICTCRPYLAYAIEKCIENTQKNGVGLIVYNRKEGRALGEVTKFLVYNARKRQEGGDRADKYFERTECIAGVQDVRFQQLMPDVLHWLGIKKIHNFVSMSNMKYGALTGQGITVENRITIPDEMIPADASVEMSAKVAEGYYGEGLSTQDTDKVTGRDYE